MNVKINSLYICVKDMERAISFYEKLLEQEVTERDSLYSVFSIHGFRVGLFAYEKAGEKHVFGSNCLPSFSFERKEELEQKIADKEICFPMTKIKTPACFRQTRQMGRKSCSSFFLCSLQIVLQHPLRETETNQYTSNLPSLCQHIMASFSL